MIVLNSAEIRRLEEKSAQLGMKHIRLMENAGTAAARILRQEYEVQGKRVAVLCGRGNNGGDGFVLARRLHQEGAQVTVILLMGSPTTADAAEMLLRATSLGISAVDYFAAASSKNALRGADILVDALFGTGFHGGIHGELAEAIEFCNGLEKPIFSLDLPSGAECDTARVEGACFRATHTVSFHTLKPVHVMFPAAEYCGQVTVTEVGVPKEAMDSVQSRVQTVELQEVIQSLPDRPVDSNKGTFGRAMSVCGKKGMAGAAVLAARAAGCCGVGLTEVCSPESLYPVLAPLLIEPIHTPLKENSLGMISEGAVSQLEQSLSRATACLVGCGLGVHADTVAVVSYLLNQNKVPLVVDADGINCLARNIHEWRAAGPVVLTPHPGEMARLLGCGVEDVQKNRLEWASSFAQEHNVTLVLKGAATLVACADGRMYVNPTGNHGMAKGGCGDLLAGMILSFLAQGMSPEDAAKAAVYLHGLAGDRAAERWSARAMQPSQMLEMLCEIFREIEQGK